MTVSHTVTHTRASYGSCIQNCPSGLKANPEDYGYACADDGLLLPLQNQFLIPDDFPSFCNCAMCATVKCP